MSNKTHWRINKLWYPPFKCVYFYKCKISLIAIKFILHQAMSRPMAWPRFPICLCCSCSCWGWLIALHLWIFIYSMGIRRERNLEMVSWRERGLMLPLRLGGMLFVLNVFNFTNVKLHYLQLNLSVSCSWLPRCSCPSWQKRTQR